VSVPAPLRALSNRDYRIFWLGQLVSLIGTWMQSVGQSWLVLQLTSSAFLLGLLTALQFTPMLCFSVFAGAFADRLRKRRLLLATQSLLLVQALTLSVLVWTGHVRYWHVAVLATMLGAVTTIDMPARQSFVADMVGRDLLMNAIALNSAVFNAARVVGPAVAGLLVARWGVAMAFLLNAISFVAVIIALLFLKTEGKPRDRDASTVLDDIREGIVYALRTPRIAFVLALLFPVSLFVFNFNVLVPLLARDVLHEGAHGFGVLMAALGAGSLTAAVGVAVLGRARPRLRVLVIAALTATVATLLMTFVRQFHLAAVVLVVIGGSGILFMTTANTTLQIATPDTMRSRMMSLYTLVFAGVTPFGSLLMGTVAQHFGVPGAFATAGGLGFAMVLGLIIWRWFLRPAEAVRA
jgi:MFS family permease